MSLHRSSLQPAVHAGDHTAGAADAPVTLVEYGDFQCPHCARAHPVVQEIQRRMGDRLRFVFRNFPLTEVHPFAGHAAEASESVAERAGSAAYWAMNHQLFAHQADSSRALADRHLAEYAATSGASGEEVLADIAAGRFTERVASDFMSGVKSGVNGTPTFFIHGERFDGNWGDVDEFAAALEDAASSPEAAR
ncbi:MAG: thioredoxin domain-containing protein [Thermoanaerobaculia bacterium]